MIESLKFPNPQSLKITKFSKHQIFKIMKLSRYSNPQNSTTSSVLQILKIRYLNLARLSVETMLPIMLTYHPIPLSQCFATVPPPRHRGDSAHQTEPRRAFSGFSTSFVRSNAPQWCPPCDKTPQNTQCSHIYSNVTPLPFEVMSTMGAAPGLLDLPEEVICEIFRFVDATALYLLSK